MATNNATNTSNPITVAQGGTGDASLTAYAVLCGGTTSTAAVQSIAALGSSGNVLTSNGAGALPTFQAAAGGTGFSVLAGQIFTASGAFTYTPTANMKYVLVELVGGGGGSGGTAHGSVTTGNTGGGGGGAYAKFILTAAQVGASLTGSVGAGGLAGVSSAGTGGTGGSTTLATSSPWTASGGVGSVGVTATNVATSVGGAGGTVTTGTGTVLNSIPGQAGGYANYPITGSGGNSGLGLGALGTWVTAGSQAAGVVGGLYGGGAAGSIVAASGTSTAGSAGAIGVAIFTEYC